MIFQKILFTSDECNNIISLKKTNHQEWGHVKGRDYESESILFQESSKWIFDRLINFFKESTTEEITNINKNIHFHRYDTDMFFEKHNDRIYNRLFIIGTILNVDYDGGDFIVYDEKDVIIEKTIGNTYCFDSKLYHEVKRIKNGTKKSMVYFIHQDNLKYEVNKLL